MDGERLELAAPATRWETAYLAFLDDFEAASELRIPAGNAWNWRAAISQPSSSGCKTTSAV